MFVDRFFAEPEICEFDVTFGVEQDVFRLQVSIDDSLTVQVLQRQRDLGHVEARLQRFTKKCWQETFIKCVKKMIVAVEKHQNMTSTEKLKID